MTKLQLPNLHQTIINMFLSINISNSNNLNNLFTASSSCCDIIKQLASFTGIKFTKRYGVSQSVSQLLTSIANDRTRVR